MISDQLASLVQNFFTPVDWSLVPYDRQRDLPKLGIFHREAIEEARPETIIAVLVRHDEGMGMLARDHRHWYCRMRHQAIKVALAGERRSVRN